MIHKSAAFWTLVAGLVAYLAKFFYQDFPLDQSMILSGILFLLGLIGIYPQVRFGLLRPTFKDLLSSLPFLSLVAGISDFVLHFYFPTWPFSDAVVLALFVFALGFFHIIPSAMLAQEIRVYSDKLLTAVAMVEELVPGDYTALGSLYIRSQMKTSPSSNIVGMYSNGVPFTVYQVYPEKDGIVWGRVSSNTGDGKSRYVGLRVLNNSKAKLEQPATPPVNSLEAGVLALASNIAALNTNIISLIGVIKK